MEIKIIKSENRIELNNFLSLKLMISVTEVLS